MRKRNSNQDALGTNCLSLGFLVELENLVETFMSCFSKKRVAKLQPKNSARKAKYNSMDDK